MPYAAGIDLGRRCGLALAGPSYLRGWKPRSQLEGPRESNDGLTFDEWDLGKHASWDFLYGNLWRRLDNLHAATPLTVLAYESAGTRFESEAAIMVVAGLAICCMAWCNVREVKAHPVHNLRMKKHATGSGNAEKEAIAIAAQRLGWHTPGEHADDAAFVLDLCLTEWQRR